jgi:hypothetical protein
MKGVGLMQEPIKDESQPLESPIESEETAAKNEVEVVKPVQVRIIEYPRGFDNHQLSLGFKFQVNGEIFEVYHVMEKKKGIPRYMIRGIGILAVVDYQDPRLQETETAS